MSIRVDTTSWLAGAILVGSTGFGVLGSAIASSGTAGPGYAYNDLALPADAGKEICGRITTFPSFGTIEAYEDTSFTYTRSNDGTDSFSYQLYVDGVAVGSPQTVTLTVGATTTINLTGATTTQGATSGTGSVGVVPPVAGVINLAGSSTTQASTSAAGAATVTPPAGGVANLAGTNCTQAATSGTGTVGVTPYVPGTVNLAGSTCVQVATCTAVAVSAGRYARAPSGSGYHPRSQGKTVRPPQIQR